MTATFFFLQWIERRLAACYKRMEWKCQILKAEAWKAECQAKFDALDEESKAECRARDFWNKTFGPRTAHAGIRVASENQHGSGTGAQVCSDCQWDNAVRAFEEDR